MFFSSYSLDMDLLNKMMQERCLLPLLTEIIQGQTLTPFFHIKYLRSQVRQKSIIWIFFKDLVQTVQCYPNREISKEEYILQFNIIFLCFSNCVH